MAAGGQQAGRRQNTLLHEPMAREQAARRPEQPPVHWRRRRTTGSDASDPEYPDARQKTDLQHATEQAAQGSSVLIDRASRERATGRIMAVRTVDGIVIRNIVQDNQGRWFMEGGQWDQNPPMECLPDCVALGQAVYIERCFL